MLRCPDTIRQHNSTRYARDQGFYVGKDKLDFIERIIRIGGNCSLHNTLLKGVCVTERPEVELPTVAELDGARSATEVASFGASMRPLLKIKLVPCLRYLINRHLCQLWDCGFFFLFFIFAVAPAPPPIIPRVNTPRKISFTPLTQVRY